MMCAGAVVQFRIPCVVAREVATFGGSEDFLRSRGVAVVVLNEGRCTMGLTWRCQSERPAIWTGARPGAATPPPVARRPRGPQARCVHLVVGRVPGL